MQSHATFNATAGTTTITYNGLFSVTLNGVSPQATHGGGFHIHLSGVPERRVLSQLLQGAPFLREFDCRMSMVVCDSESAH